MAPWKKISSRNASGNNRRRKVKPLVPQTPGAAESPAGAPVDVYDYERLARERLSPMAWDYIAGGAADELTLRWNREAYDRLRLRPRVLVDVSQLDTRVTLLGRTLPFPILLAPAAYQRLLHPDGELAAVRGADAAEATLVASCFASTTIEETAAAARRPLWFQLYVNPDRGFTRALVQRVEAAGCEALVLTVDSPTLGPRYRELRNRFTLPPGVERANLRGLATATGGQRPTEKEIYSATLDPTLGWRDVEWLRSLTRLPVLLKGILNADDAARAVEIGAAGVIVSNHGGRNLDTLPATIEALPGVAAKVAGRVPVLVDGGIRRGTDVFKALALGAQAVLIGRPYLCGLAAGGAEGVARVVTILRREFEMAMALTGRTSLAAIDESVLWR
ncbi:MAG TPA: alpha-hydroxy acid oxidase [Opitutaceae bacterium]|nr:alpha-hydroxy acid oxidase [Opitutaceae bacterium]